MEKLQFEFDFEAWMNQMMQQSIRMTGLIYHQLRTEPVFHHSAAAAAAAAAASPIVTPVQSI